MDELFARLKANGTAAWYVTDRMGSVRDIVDESGAVIDHLDYDGFGNITNETNPSASDRWKWTGRESDSDAELQYNRARYYDAKVGRWTTEDPIGFAAGDGNIQRYVSNSPTRLTDPSGLSGETNATKLGKAAHKKYPSTVGGKTETLPSGRRLDSIRESGKTVYIDELKPEGRVAGRGVKYRMAIDQLMRYVREKVPSIQPTKTIKARLVVWIRKGTGFQFRPFKTITIKPPTITTVHAVTARSFALLDILNIFHDVLDIHNRAQESGRTFEEQLEYDRRTKPLLMPGVLNPDFDPARVGRPDLAMT